MSSTSNDERTSDSLERILNVATVMLAEHGYHGVSTRALAEAVGLNISTINYHVGSKQDLYRRVFERLFHQEFELMSRFAGYVDDEVIQDRAALRDLLQSLVDALIDMTREHPEVPRLWVRRWLEREFLFDEIEVDYSLPLYEMVCNVLDRARQAGTVRADGPDARLFLISFTWMLYGYFTGGPIAWNEAHGDPFDPDQIVAFKEFLHDYLCRMLDL